MGNYLSYWEQTTFFKTFDVAIIGSGIVGLNAAIHLKTLSPNLDIVVLEKGVLPSGASTKNAGFACFGSVSELIDDLENHSEQAVFHLVEQRWNGLQRLINRIGKQNIGYKSYGSYELYRLTENTAFESCLERVPYLNKMLNNVLNIPNVFSLADNKIKTFGFDQVQHLIYNKAEGQIDTGKMMKSLLDLAKEKGITIYNGCSIKKLEDNPNNVEIVTSDNWKLKANKVLVATNGFTAKLFPDLEVVPARNQVLITKPIKQLAVKGCFHYDKGYYYFRNVGDRVLFGGGRNLALDAEQTSDFGTTELIRAQLTQFLQQIIIPNTYFEIEQWWSGILGVGGQKTPIVKRVSKNIAVSVRLGGMGVAIGTLIGEQGADLLFEM